MGSLWCWLAFWRFDVDVPCRGSDVADPASDVGDLGWDFCDFVWDMCGLALTLLMFRDLV